MKFVLCALYEDGPVRECDAKAAHLGVLERLGVVGLLVPGVKRKEHCLKRSLVVSDANGFSIL